MSRDHCERRTAWEVWMVFHTQDKQQPIAYEHQCGAVSKLRTGDLGQVVCSGCRHELARPEYECDPLYGPTSHRAGETA